MLPTMASDRRAMVKRSDQVTCSPKLGVPRLDVSESYGDIFIVSFFYYTKLDSRIFSGLGPWI